MVTIKEVVKGCRYWGYEPSSGENRFSLTTCGTLEKMRAVKAKFKAECDAVKAAGYKATAMGMTKAEAEAQAKALESRFPDIAFTIFSHDYL